jgi:putative FmdB family regulatory protein
MPIFDYYCTSCHHTCEILHKLSDPTPDICPHCSKNGLVKKLSSPGIRLAGNGWYETDEKPKEKQRNIAQTES